MRDFVVSLFLLLLFFACSKEQPNVPSIIPPDPVDTTAVPVDTVKHVITFGKYTVLKNGETWNGTFKPIFYPNRRDLFLLRGGITYTNLRGEGLGISDIPCKKGRFPIEFDNYINDFNFIPQASFGITQDFDQAIGFYNIDTTRKDNFIEVLEYDSITHIVEGRFQVFMGKDVTSNPWNVPDSIFLTDGKFHLKIEE